MFITCFSQRSGHSLSFFWVRFLINVCFRYTDTWCFVGLKLGQQCIPLIESWGKRWLQWSWKEESWMEDSIVQESCEEHLILWHYKDKRGWIKIKIRKKKPCKWSKANSDPEMSFIVGHKTEERRQNCSQQGSIEWSNSRVPHGLRMKTKDELSESSDETTECTTKTSLDITK